MFPAARPRTTFTITCAIIRALQTIWSAWWRKRRKTAMWRRCSAADAICRSLQAPISICVRSVNVWRATCPIQGTAADIIKIAMVHVRNRLKAEKLDAKLILQVHDELIVECPEAESDTGEENSGRRNGKRGALSVPMLAEAGSGKSWYQAKG